MNSNTRNIFDIKVMLGIGIVAVAIVLLLSNMRYIPYVSTWDFWPLILIIFGIHHLAAPSQSRQTTIGILFIGIGTLFLLDNLDIIYYRFSDWWPIILLIIGAVIIKHALTGTKSGAMDSDNINLLFTLSGGDHRFTSKSLKGGKIAAFMGGGKLDLTGSDFQGEEIVIDVFALMGGFEIVVPKHWQVNVQGVPFMGGMENKTRPEENGISSKKCLVIKGLVIMGGVDIKN